MIAKNDGDFAHKGSVVKEKTIFKPSRRKVLEELRRNVVKKINIVGIKHRIRNLNMYLRQLQVNIALPNVLSTLPNVQYNVYRTTVRRQSFFHST